MDRAGDSVGEAARASSTSHLLLRPLRASAPRLSSALQAEPSEGDASRGDAHWSPWALPAGGAVETAWAGGAAALLLSLLPGP